MNRDAAMARAAQLIRRAGFVFVNKASNSESQYYAWPGYDDKLRLSAHKWRGERSTNKTDVVSKITFHNNLIDITEQKVENLVAAGIGRYFLKSKDRVKEGLSELTEIAQETDNLR